MSMNKSIPTSKLARAKVAGGAALKTGYKHLSHKAKQPFQSAEMNTVDKEKLDEEISQILFDTFSKLRGSALKMAQMLSMDSHLLPDPIRAQLTKSYHQVPPLGRPLINKIFQQEFGKPAGQLFDTFNHHAFAAASLGQVHRASSGTNKLLAVKLQYPGIDVTIDSDIQLARSLIKRTAHAKLLLSSLDEIEYRLHEEVDYRLEADNTEWFYEHLQLPDIAIPNVHREFSTERILTTSLMPGLHLEQWLKQSPSQGSRNHFAQQLYDLFVKSFYGLHVLHADPNPGNFLFTDNGTLNLLDFGCVRHFSNEFVTLVPQLLHAYMAHDAEAVIITYQKLGMMVTDMSTEELEQFYQDLLQPFGDWFSKPFKTESFDFSSHRSPYTKEGWGTLKKFSRVKKISSIANEFIYFDRTLLGLYQIFERMEAKVNMEHPWLIY